jgi:uncharacterized protein
MFDLERIRTIALNHHIKSLEVFGSVARGAASPSDYDFIVEFQPLSPLEHGRMYFSLLATLEDLLDAKVDLLELEALKNPYFLASIQADRKVLYAA